MSGQITAEPQRFGLVVPIASITAVGLGLSLSIPLLSITLEMRGITAAWIGINAATSGLASIVITPFVPQIAARLGTTAALVVAILVSAATLPLFYLTENFWLWFPLRILSGACLTTTFVLSEFWIATAAPPHRRGFIMGLYATILSIGFALGPAILALAGTSGFRPFIVGAVILAVAALPIVLSAGASPTIDRRPRGGFLRFLVIAPAATGAAIAFGFAEAGSFALLPVYGQHAGHAVEQVVLLAAALTLGNVLFQIPLGLISDRVNRPRLLLVIALVGALGAALLPLASPSIAATLILLFVWGGFIGGLYSVGLAHLAQRFTGADLAGANAAFVFCYSVGSLFGPATLGLGMEAWDPQGFAAVLAIWFLIYTGILIVRLRRPGD